jgi:hypothetical protein
MIFKPKTNDQRSNLEKIRDQCHSANDAALEAANKEPNLNKRLAMYLDIEIAQKQQRAAIAASKAEYVEPKELTTLKQWRDSYRLNDVGLSESTSVAQAIQQFETENYDPVFAKELFDKASAKRTARIEEFNRDKRNRMAELQSQLIETATEQHDDVPDNPTWHSLAKEALSSE